MKRRIFATCALGITAIITITACDSDRTAAPPSDLAPSLAKGGNIDTDSRALLVWDDIVEVSIDGVPTMIPAGIQGDGYDRLSTDTLADADAYQGQVCGVHAKIFNTSSLSGSGDLVFDPDFDAPGKSCNGVSRKLRFYLNRISNTDAGLPTPMGTFLNVRRIWALVSGETIQPMRLIFAGESGCESFDFNSASGGDNIRVTRHADSPDGSANWRVESTGGHLAACMVTYKSKLVANGLKFLPFAFNVTEVKYQANP
jgi:hypothetical protein